MSSSKRSRAHRPTRAWDAWCLRARALRSAPGAISGSAPQGAEPQRPTQEDRADTLLHHGETTRLLHCMPKPTIAMINGVAAGAGLALALACDLRLMSRAAVLTTAYVKVGLCGDLGMSYFLTHLVGPARARELLFLNPKIDAETALQWGLANRIEDPDGLSASALGVARQLGRGARRRDPIHEAESASRGDANLARGARKRGVRHGALRPHPRRKGGRACISREAASEVHRILTTPCRFMRAHRWMPRSKMGERPQRRGRRARSPRRISRGRVARSVCRNSPSIRLSIDSRPRTR